MSIIAGKTDAINMDETVRGACPTCKCPRAYINGPPSDPKSHYWICDSCMTYELIGCNLYSSWRDETEEDRLRNEGILTSGEYRDVATVAPTPNDFRRSVYAASAKLADGVPLDNIELLTLARLALEQIGGRR
jgi:hypothetical protein